MPPFRVDGHILYSLGAYFLGHWVLGRSLFGTYFWDIFFGTVGSYSFRTFDLLYCEGYGASFLGHWILGCYLTLWDSGYLAYFLGHIFWDSGFI